MFIYTLLECEEIDGQNFLAAIVQGYFPKKVKVFITKLTMNLLRGAERRKCFRVLFQQLTVPNT
jgi:hypothetical protein